MGEEIVAGIGIDTSEEYCVCELVLEWVAKDGLVLRSLVVGILSAAVAWHIG